MKVYLVAFIVFLVIDAIWLGLVAPKFYKNYLGHIMADKPNLIVALVFYLIFILGLVYFVINPAIEANDISKLLVSAALFGIVTYSTYDLTNMATLKDCPVIVTVVDLIWGTFISTAVSFITFLILR